MLVIDTVTITDMVFIAFVFAGITAASITSLGVDRLSLTLFLATSLLPLLFCFFSIGGYMPNIMASMIFLFMIYLIVNGNRFRKQIVANVELTSEALQGKKALLNRQLISELIVEIQTAYLDKQLTLKLFDNVLEEIINLSGVQYGFICQVEQRSAYELSSKVLVNLGGLNLTQLNGDALKVDELNLRPLSLEAYISQVIISRKNIEVDHIEVFEGEPRTMVIGNLFGIPLLANGKVIAVIGFVDLYDTNLEERIVFLNPLFQTIERILSNFSYGELERALEGGLDK
ncbi:hypothetical protein JYU22_01935 [Gammaproteobacteria bacterium AH-315-E17]|nr:hypothetical protein [Gammaproteobacteria bacterium AH-315-E17]